MPFSSPVRHVRTLLALALLAACVTTEATSLKDATARLELPVYPTNGAAIATKPHVATVMLGGGLLLRATVTDVAGQEVAGAKPTFMVVPSAADSAGATLVTLIPYRDSVDARGTCVVVMGARVGSAMVVAHYASVSDTARITVVAPVDSTVFHPIGSRLVLNVHAAAMRVGDGLRLAALITDSVGHIVPGAHASYIALPSGVVSLSLLPDTFNSCCLTVQAMAPGTAVVLAQYGSLHDSLIVTVVPGVDSTQPPTSSGTFDVLMRVDCCFPTSDSSGVMGQPVSGVLVTLTRLPLAPGDSAPTGYQPVVAPTPWDSLRTNTAGVVRFRAVPVGRIRLDVTPWPSLGVQPFTQSFWNGGWLLSFIARLRLLP